MQDNRVFLNKKIRWRYEGAGKILIYFDSSRFCLLNETASEIFTRCHGLNLDQILSLYGFPLEAAKRSAHPEVKAFLEALVNKGIITQSPEPMEGIAEPKGKGGLVYRFSPSAKFFDLADMNHLHFNRPRSPLRVFFTISDQCNLRCKHCYNASSDPGSRASDFSLDNVKHIIEKLNQAAVFKVILTGGEPFLNPYIFEIIDYIRARGMTVRINTNGTLVNEENIQELKKRNDVIVTLGIDGTSAGPHEYIRGKGTFVNAIRVLERLSARQYKIYINFTATKTNFAEVFKLKGFFSQYPSVERVIVNVFIRTGKGLGYGDGLALTKPQYALLHCFSRLNSNATKPPLIAVFTDCYAGHVESYLDYQGRMFFCDLLHKPIGNIFEKSFEALWDSPELLALVNPERFGRPCRDCLFRRSCRGACRAEVFARTNDLYAGNPYCLRGRLSSLVKFSFMGGEPSARI